jgi:hypothetical protein
MSLMDIDYNIKKDIVFLEEKEDKKDKRKKQRKVLLTAEENLRVLVIEKINGRMGDC